MNRLLGLAALALSSACAAQPAEPAATASGEAAPTATPPEATPTPEPGMSAVPPASQPGTAASTTVPPPAPGVPALPALTVKTMGLHVGGGPNDQETKAPFLSAIEPRFPEFLRCYQLVTDPGKGGSFGIDLRIAARGGKAEVEQPRSALSGEAFTACMVSVFESVEFPPLKKAFVISYSLRFSVEG